MRSKVSLRIPSLHLKRIKRSLDVAFWIFVKPNVLLMSWRKFKWVWINVHYKLRLHVNYCRII